MEKLCRLWLLSIARVQRSGINHILDKFGSAEAFYNLSAKEIQNLKFLSDSEKERILKKELDLAKNYLSYIENNQTKFITPLDEEFPRALFEIEDCPQGLFLRGKGVDLNNNIFVSVVGARKCTQYGFTSAKTLSRDIANEGAIIVSGMALGIDSAAHEGALEANMPTVAVFGCGVNVVYPPTNHNLMKRIMETGMVISEYPVNTEPTRYTFPERNRIISGIANAILVVEATNRSGSLITARCAAEQGKDLFAVPGNINSVYSGGTNELIKDGAHLVSCGEDVTFYYKSQLEQIKKHFKKENVKTNEYYGLSGDNNDIEAKISSILTSEPISVEQICDKLDIDISSVSTALLIMELAGKVMAYPGGKYSSPLN